MYVKSINGKSNIIGKNIKKYRESLNLSQRQLSDKLSLLGITLYNPDISLIENEKLPLKDFEIVAICKVLNITYDELFENAINIFD